MQQMTVSRLARREPSGCAGRHCDLLAEPGYAYGVVSYGHLPGRLQVSQNHCAGVLFFSHERRRYSKATIVPNLRFSNATHCPQWALVAYDHGA